jgi:hypothetical protein
MIDLDCKSRSNEYFTHSSTGALKLSREMLRPVCDRMRWILSVRGTGAHVGIDSEHEEELFNTLENTVPVGGRYALPDLWQLIDGVKVYARHTRSVGQNALMDIGRMWRGQDDKPKIAVYGHGHMMQDSHDIFKHTRILFNGCWQMGGSYSSTLRTIDLPDIGGYVTVCDAGKVEVFTFRWKPRGRQWTVLS